MIEQLWASRYAAAATLLSAGANVFHMDTDTILVSDPYLALKRPPFSKHNFIFLRESPINGGLWYAQEKREGEGAQWIIAELARRTLRLLRALEIPFNACFRGALAFSTSDSETSRTCADNSTKAPNNSVT